MSNPIPEEKIAELSEMIFQGRKIEAIKVYRELAGGGLKDAKEAVEGMEASLRQTSPEKFSAARGRGCSAGAAILVLGVAGVCYVITRV